MNESAAIANKFHRILDLGRGGMARVWLAATSESSGAQKLLVVKQLRHEALGNQHMQDQFLKEAELAAKLNHPNVVQTLEVCEDAGEHFLVMEYLEGTTLRAILARRKLPTNILLSILADVCAGLHYAHELADFTGAPLNIVHRDVSPENIFVTFSGQVKLLDFGIAKANTKAGHSDAKLLKGKLSYMAPEQARGETVDARTDVFSVGMVLAEALQGKAPWAGIPGPQVLQHLERGQIPRLDEGLESELASIITRATAARAEQRFESALSLQAAFESYLQTSNSRVTRREISAFVSSAFEAEHRRTKKVIVEKVSALNKSEDLKSVLGRRLARPKPPLPKGPSKPLDALKKHPQPQKQAAKPLVLPAPYVAHKRLVEGRPLYAGINEHTQRKLCLRLLNAKPDTGPNSELLKLSKLRHPHTVKLLDIAELESPSPMGLLVREHIEGHSLADELTQNGRLEPERALHLLRQVLMSLAEAHDLGLVHGALAPEHVLVEQNSSGEDSARVIYSMTRLKSGPYVAPEVQETHKLRPQGDLFSAMVILHQCLFGKLPNSEEPSAEAAESPDVSAFFNKALAPDPLARYQSVSDLLQAIRELDWFATNEPRSTRDQFLYGCHDNAAGLLLSPPRNELMSTRSVTVWVLEDDPAMSDPAVAQAISELASEHEVRKLGAADRELALEQLRTGSVLPPWVVIFGDLSVILNDPILHALGSCAEMSRLLLSTHDNFELLQNSINQNGLDHHIGLPSDAQTINEAVARLIQRSRRLNHHYDAIRIALKKTRDEVGELSRELAAANDQEGFARPSDAGFLIGNG